jgi:hypothetical protein
LALSYSAGKDPPSKSIAVSSVHGDSEEAGEKHAKTGASVSAKPDCLFVQAGGNAQYGLLLLPGSGYVIRG